MRSPLLLLLLLPALMLVGTGACTSASPAAPTAAAVPAITTAPAANDTTTTSATTAEVVIGVDGSLSNTSDKYTIAVSVDGAPVAFDEVDPTRGSSLPHETRVKATKDKLDARIDVVIEARANAEDDPEGKYDPFLRRRATFHFVKGETRLAYIHLEDRCTGSISVPSLFNYDVAACASPQTCSAGKCIPEAIEELPPYRNDWATDPPATCGALVDAAPAPVASITIGRGLSEMTRIRENETLMLECGSQGGHHLWLAFQMAGLDPNSTITTITAKGGDGNIVEPTVLPPSWASSTNVTTAPCEIDGARFQLDATQLITPFLGKPLDITVSAVDKVGHTATATRHVNISAQRSGDTCFGFFDDVSPRTEPPHVRR